MFFRKFFTELHDLRSEDISIFLIQLKPFLLTAVVLLLFSKRLDVS